MHLMKTAFILAACLWLAAASLPAEQPGRLADSPAASPDDIKAEREAKKAAAVKKSRDKLKFKWHKTLKAALAAAKKNNTVCVVLYSDPSFCHYCAKLDQEIFESREFKAARGIGVGYRSTSPISQYQLAGSMPRGAIVGPDGRKISDFGYAPGQTAEGFVKLLRKSNPEMNAPETPGPENAPR